MKYIVTLKDADNRILKLRVEAKSAKKAKKIIEKNTKNNINNYGYVIIDISEEILPDIKLPERKQQTQHSSESEVRLSNDEEFGKRVWENSQVALAKEFKNLMKKLAEENSHKIKNDEKYIYINVSDINHAFENGMKKRIEESDYDFDTILCITRGGLVPAGVAAYQLGIKNIVCLEVSSYIGEGEKEDIKINKLSKTELKKLAKAKGILIIDDIIDTGDTLDEVTQYLIKKFGDDIFRKTNVLSIVSKISFPKMFNLFDFSGDDRWVKFEWDK